MGKIHDPKVTKFILQWGITEIHTLSQKYRDTTKVIFWLCSTLHASIIYPYTTDFKEVTSKTNPEGFRSC